MTKTFYVSYKLYGTIAVEGESEEEIRGKFDPSDEDLVQNLSRSYRNMIDGDAIEIYDVREEENE